MSLLLYINKLIAVKFVIV